MTIDTRSTWDQMRDRVKETMAVVQPMHEALLPVITSEGNDFLHDHLTAAYMELIQCDRYLNLKLGEINIGEQATKEWAERLKEINEDLKGDNP